jgi:D-alanine transaminase
MSVYLNGSYADRSTARVSVEDRGFIFGDGCYEVWRAVNGTLFEFERHRSRLEHGLRELEIARPAELESAALRTIAERLLDGNGARDGNATFYVQVTRGAAPRTHYFPPSGTPPTVYATASRFTPPPAAMRASGAAALTMPDIRWLRCDLKTIQLLPNVLGKQRAVSTGAVDTIFVRDGTVTEGTHTNVFAVVGGIVRTHPLSHHILAGVTRDVVLELAAGLGIAIREEAVTADELRDATEVFLTGTTTDVLGITSLDGGPVGTGRPGPITAALYDALAERLGLRAEIAAPR